MKDFQEDLIEQESKMAAYHEASYQQEFNEYKKDKTLLISPEMQMFVLLYLYLCKYQSKHQC